MDYICKYIQCNIDNFKMKNPIRKYLGLLLSVIVFMAQCIPGQTNRKVYESINTELANYPEAELTDIYKNFFQDAFGPSHMLADTQAVINYLKKELDAAEGFDSLLLQPLGTNHNYYRVNLLLVKNGAITCEELVDAFIGSANLATPPSISNWKKTWDEVLVTIKKMDVRFTNFTSDSIFIDSLLNSGNYVVHHSNKYKQLYNPHYRIVHKDLLPETLKPLIGL